MLEHLGSAASDRKLRLFMTACCRRIWHLLKDESSREAVEVSERYADGLAAEKQLIAARSAILPDRRFFSDPGGLQLRTRGDRRRAGFDAVIWAADANPRVAASESVRLAAHASGDWWVEYRAQVALLREVFGNPFRPVPFELAWRTAATEAIAQTIYDERRFDDLPILADALEEAGCTDTDILAHCRLPGEHVRGCWVIDLVLGKT